LRSGDAVEVAEAAHELDELATAFFGCRAASGVTFSPISIAFAPHPPGHHRQRNPEYLEAHPRGSREVVGRPE
jgi:hypothetical protein